MVWRIAEELEKASDVVAAKEAEGDHQALRLGCSYLIVWIVLNLIFLDERRLDGPQACSFVHFPCALDCARSIAS